MAKKITVSAAMASHPLAPAVLHQLGGGKDAVQSAIDAANNGANGGFSGFITYTETTAFTRRNRKAILSSAMALADSFDEDTVEMVARWARVETCKNYALNVGAVLTGGLGVDDEDVTTITNALAWWALEEVGNAVLNLRDE